jgi:hypothetical protein
MPEDKAPLLIDIEKALEDAYSTKLSNSRRKEF